MLSIIVPVCNGGKTLLRLIESIKLVVKVIDDEWELIFIDDGSTDNSLSIIRGAAEADARIGWVSFVQNAGQQLAVLCGLRHSRGDYIITMDDDLAHPAEIIPRLYEEIKKGSDAVYAVPQKQSKAGGLMRDLFFRCFLKKPAGLRIGSFRIFTRAAAELISKASQPFVYISAELFRAGMKITSIEYTSACEDSEPDVAASRYSFYSRSRLYFKLFRWYGPAGSRMAGQQYQIECTGGCL